MGFSKFQNLRKSLETAKIFLINQTSFCLFFHFSQFRWRSSGFFLEILFFFHRIQYFSNLRTRFFSKHCQLHIYWIFQFYNVANFLQNNQNKDCSFKQRTVFALPFSEEIALANITCEVPFSLNSFKIFAGFSFFFIRKNSSRSSDSVRIKLENPF